MARASLTLLAASGALLAGCASMGWHTYASAPRAQQMAANSPDQICKDLAPTGSRMVRRECHTRAEWDSLADEQMQKFNQDAARSLPTTDPGSASGR